MNHLSDIRILIAYKGPITMQVLASLGNYFKSIPFEDNIARTRLFKTFMEVTQNISLYSAERVVFRTDANIGVGMIKIHEDDDYFYITTKNKIHEQDSRKLQNYCNEINSKNHESLRLLKSSNIKSKKEHENSAHLGLIHIALLTSNKLEFKVDSENLFFELTVKVNKKYT